MTVYDPFGNTTQSGISSNPFQFSGRENDGTGLYFYRARYYSPSLQRFISEDPIGLRGGEINFYTYANNSPISIIDPSGLFVVGAGGSASLGAFGVGDVAGGVVVDTSGNVAGFTYGGISSGPQFAASAGGTVVVAPFASTVNDIKGATFDFQIRFGFQITVSVPVDFNIKNTSFSFDFPPGINLGLGFGGGYTNIYNFKNGSNSQNNSQNNCDCLSGRKNGSNCK